MPFYEYECTNCKFYVEALQKISDDPIRKCPSCKKQAMKRLVSAPVFRLKGGGWYETDFKSDAEQKRNIAGKEEGEGKAEEAKADDTKKEGAEAAKPAETDAKKGDGKAPEKKAAEGKSAARKSAASKPTPKPASRSKPRAKPSRSKPAAKKKSKRR